MTDTPLRIADREFTSRLMMGTGKFASNESMKEALEASGSQIVTVALRRADLTGNHDPAANILDFINPEKYLILPNTSGAATAEEAVRLARLAVAAGLPNWIKLEIHPDAQYLMPDPIETLKATGNPRPGRLYRSSLHQRRPRTGQTPGRGGRRRLSCPWARP